MGIIRPGIHSRNSQSLSLMSPPGKHKRSTTLKRTHSKPTSENFPVILHLTFTLAFPAGYHTLCPHTPYTVTEDQLRRPIHRYHRCSFTFSNCRNLQFHILFCERPRFHCYPLCPCRYRTRVTFKNHLTYKHKFNSRTTHRFRS